MVVQNGSWAVHADIRLRISILFRRPSRPVYTYNMSTVSYSQAPFPPSCAPNIDRLSPHDETASQNASPQAESTARYITFIPGDPAVSLFPKAVHDHLSNQLETPLLDELYEKLWIVAKKSSRNIDPLHTQRVKGRSIIPTEDAKLHLVWYHDKIYVKPVPVYLLNHDFWTTYLQPLKEHGQSQSHTFDRSVAIGFLRSYALLVSCRLDFLLAKEVHLIPDDVEDWSQWSQFISHFRYITDESVAKRYHYGQLRLTRLNWAVRIFSPRHTSTIWFYELSQWSITDFVKSVTVPLLFLFASLSLALSSMQVILSVPVDDPWFHGLGDSGLQNLSRAFWVLSITVMLGLFVVWFLFLGIPLTALAWQISWGYMEDRKMRRAISDA
jgi:hypothetical protein